MGPHSGSPGRYWGYGCLIELHPLCRDTCRSLRETHHRYAVGYAYRDERLCLAVQFVAGMLRDTKKCAEISSVSPCHSLPEEYVVSAWPTPYAVFHREGRRAGGWLRLLLSNERQAVFQ